MKAVKIIGEKQFAVVDMENPITDKNWVTVKVDTVGICGSDIHYWAAGASMTKNWILGHEYAGTVAEPGARADLKVGDRVVVVPSKGCPGCEYCQSDRANLCEIPITKVVGNGAPEGAYAEYVSARPETVVKLEDHVSLEDASMIEPCTVGLHAINRAGILVGESILIVGAGIIGLMTAMWARKKGVKYIAMSEVGEARLKKAKEYGLADAYYDAKDSAYIEKMKAENSGKYFDKVIDCVGISQTFDANIAALKPDGTYVMVGIPVTPIPLNIPPFIIREQKMVTVHGYVVSEFIEALGALTAGEVDLNRFITDIRPLEEAQKAFEDLSKPGTNHVKILLKPWGVK